MVLTETHSTNRMFRSNVCSDDGDDDAVLTSRSSTDQYMHAKLDRISAALIDSARILELVSFSSRDADVRVSITSAKTRLAIAVGNVQVDQQSLGLNGKVPVILAPTPVKLPQPTIQFLAWKDNIRSKIDMDSYDYVAIHVSFFLNGYTWGRAVALLNLLLLLKGTRNGSQD